MNKTHLNHVCILREGKYYVFERMGKQISYDIYPLSRNLGIGDTPEDAIRNSIVPSYDIEVIV